MSLLNTVWSMVAGACGVLCFTHLLLWLREPRRRYFLLSAVMAFVSSVGALNEMRLMQTATIPEYVTLLRVGNVVVGVMLVAMAWFVRGYLRAGRRWLAAAITALWSVGLVFNIFSPASLTFAEITSLDPRLTFWGEEFYLAVGVAHPAKYLADLASLFIMIYVVDATLGAWRQGARRSALVVGGSITLFIVAAGIHTPLVDAGVVHTPPMISIAFLAIVLALSYQIADDASRTLLLARRIRASEQRWRTLIENVQLVVLDVGPDGRVRGANPHFETLTGRTQTDVRGLPVEELVAADEALELRDRVCAADRRPPRPHSRWRLTTSDGGTRTLDWSSVRLFDAAGVYDGVLSIGADVTDEIATRHDLEQTRDRLDRVVRAGLLGELVSALSHELNQPLAAILSNAQTARLYLDREQPSVVEIQSIIDRIVRDDKRAADVIDRLRSLMTRGDIVAEELDLEMIVADVVALIRTQAEHLRVVLAIDLQPGLPKINAGRVEIQQVLLNLLVNALRSLERIAINGRRIEVAASVNGQRIELTVSDNGPGIAADQISRLFEPFHGDRDGQLGMGLTISRRIVEAYGGTISGRNDEGGGAVFTVSLPGAVQAKQAHHA